MADVSVAALLAARRRRRAQLAKTLHDDITGGLTAAGLSLDLLTLDAPPELAPRIREIQDLLERSFESVRELSAEYHPDPAIRFRLFHALERLARRCERRFAGRLIVNLVDGVDEGLTEEQCRACYMVAEEALLNAVAHARPARVWLSLENGGTTGAFQLTVRDDGVGLGWGHADGGTGMAIMEHCSRDAGLTLVVRSKPAEGTSVQLRGDRRR